MKTMSIKEIREWYIRRIEHANKYLPELIDTINDEYRTIDTLWKNGYTNKFDRYFAASVRGYNYNTGDYGITVTDTLDLHTIAATRSALKRFVTYLTI